ncbi:MAG: PorP/SprF family type IX secretion system membrane protein [Bacteroidales bacterium]
MKRCIIISIAVSVMMFLTHHGYAQDIHFSQYMFSPMNLNPAETGNFDGDYRFVVNHKRQWMSFADAYNTFSGSVDRQFLKEKKLRPGIGMLLNNDIAGDGDFGTLQVGIPVSLLYAMENTSLYVGGMASWVQHSFNYSAFYFGSQYTGHQFDPSLPTGETIDADRFSYYDFSAGAGGNYKYSDSLRFNAGVSVQHITQPVKSFYQNEEMQLNMRWQAYVQADFIIDKHISLQPTVLFMTQGKYKEYNFGSNIEFDINPLGLRSVFAGLHVRARDASILIFGLDYNKIRFNLSYDINLSGLTTISKGRGGVELSVIYLFQKLNLLTNPPVKKCPEFI